MNKTSKLFAGFAALAMMASCSNEEPIQGETGAPTLPGEGQKAYMTVSINDIGDLGAFGRSTDFGETPEFSYGTEDERKLTSAIFYFFDENGTYMYNTSWNPLTEGDGNASTSTPDENIEWRSTKMIVINGINQNTTPSYMLTVLNAPEFKAEATLAATSEKLSTWATEGEQFVMSTSSYLDENTGTYYYANALTPSDFYLSEAEAKAGKPVTIYVERLAAKTQVAINITDANDRIHLDNGSYIYRLDQTVGGTDNGDNNDEGKTDTDIYVEIVGWGLNATALQSHISKQFDTTAWTLTSTLPFNYWNSPANHRSYWGKAWTYTAQPEDSQLYYTNSTALTGELTNVNSDYAQYCYENTNSPRNIFKANSAGQNRVITNRVTHVVLNTRLCDKEGKSLKMVKYTGVLYLQEAFEAYALRYLSNTAKGLNYYKLTNTTVDAEEATTNDFAQVSTDDIELEGIAGTIGGANFKLSYTGDLYSKSVVDGKDKFTKIENVDLESRLNALNTENTPIEWFNTTDKGGNIYYIPIEHAAAGTNPIDRYQEGYYGVVRNHWYKLTVNSFSKVGHGLFDPDNGSETLKPEDTEDPEYYLGATINILSWRVINQGVDL